MKYLDLSRIDRYDDDPTPRGWRLIGSPQNAPEGSATRHAIVSGKPMTSGQRKRLARDITICTAAKAGMSQRSLADAFDLARSRVATIIEQFADRSPRC